MNLRKRSLLIAVLLGAALAAIPASGLASTSESIEATSSFSWRPENVEITPGGSVNFSNSTGVSHGITWESTPASPSCSSGVPLNEGKTNWSGSCTFTTGGTYSFRCSIHGSMTGSVVVASSGPPIATAGSGAATGDTTAGVSGTINPGGLETKYFFQYGTSISYGSKTSEIAIPAGTSPVPESATLTGLQPDTTYHFRIVGKNASGTASSEDRSFTTPGPPIVTTAAATGTTTTESILHGLVNPGGHGTTYYFNYGTTTAYGQKTAAQSLASGTAGVPVSATLTGLSPGTTYHFQVVAENSSSAGTPTLGADLTFTTASAGGPPPSEPPPATTPPTTTPPTTSQPPASGPPLGSSIKAVAGKHGAPVRVTVQILQSGAGGSLRASLLMKGSKPKSAGRFAKSGLSAGPLSFSVPLTAAAKGILRKKHRLSLTLSIQVTPPSGAAVTVTKSVVVRA